MLRVFQLIIILLLSASCINVSSLKKRISQLEKTSLNNYQVGDIVYSLLDETNFKKNHGNDWVLMKKMSLIDTKLSELTNIYELPDARGVFLRGKNNGRKIETGNSEGEKNIGHYQEDLSNRLLSVRANSGSQGDIRQTTIPHDGSWSSAIRNRHSQNPDHLVFRLNGHETRPRNITVNIFIKIN